MCPRIAICYNQSRYLVQSEAITYTGNIARDIGEQIVHTRYINIEQKDHYHDDHEGNEDDACEPEDHWIPYESSEVGTRKAEYVPPRWHGVEHFHQGQRAPRSKEKETAPGPNPPFYMLSVNPLTSATMVGS